MHYDGRIPVCKRKSHQQAGDDLRAMFSGYFRTARFEGTFDGEGDTKDFGWNFGLTSMSFLVISVFYFVMSSLQTVMSSLQTVMSSEVETSFTRLCLSPESIHYFLCPGQRSAKQGLLSCECNLSRT